MRGERLTVVGQVQGVGFRPTVWRIATEMGLIGDVRNTGDAVEIRLWGDDVDIFARRLLAEAPRLARVDRIDRSALEAAPPRGFAIAASTQGRVQAGITPDVATCDECLAEIRNPFGRRYRYPFTNCTNCGPRFSIVERAPYDRVNTTMRGFTLCAACRAEYEDPRDRRFHAQPIGCHACGPRAWIERLGGGAVSPDAFSMLDDVDAAGGMLLAGYIVAIKGIGGFHLACDATRADAVTRLRTRKRRPSKALALIARDLDIVRRYCRVSAEEAVLLQSPGAPIVLLQADRKTLPDVVAPQLGTLGFMLPHTPLHHLMLRRVTRPVVMTSGNLSGQRQCIANDEARDGLTGIADFALLHDRPIANRLDDTVVRVDLGRRLVIRRGRGDAPDRLTLPPGFAGDIEVLALGGELKNAVCLIRDGQIILSQHMGDLEDLSTSDEVDRVLHRYGELYHYSPSLIAVDLHPDYRSTQRGVVMAEALGVKLVEVQHHHAHVAACMAENAWPLDAGPVLGIALDGLGLGSDGTMWGGEFLACSYERFERLGCLKPVALPGGVQAVREPWRNAYAHLMAEMGWAEFEMNFADLPLYRRLSNGNRATLDKMIATGLNTKLSSSCGRLFDAAAALCDLAWDAQEHEGQAAMAFEAAIDPAALQEPPELAYPFAVPRLAGRGMPYVEPLGAWRALLGDLYLGTSVGVIAARFHRGFALAIVALAVKLSGEDRRFPTAALTGGCFQNATLFALVSQGLEASGFDVLSHRRVPANDGGLALGQAVVALATRQNSVDD